MSTWECGVCGHLHSGDEPPEECPVCEAPAKMFSQKEKEDNNGSDQGVKTSAAASSEIQSTEKAQGNVVKKWRCTVCGYIHIGEEPPEKCPVCLAPAAMFEPVETQEDTPLEQEAAIPRFRCTVCGYLHSGDQPPESCPVCAAKADMFVEVDAEGRALKDIDPGQEPSGREESVPKKKKRSGIGELILKLHLHPITVHFPNGVLPVAVGFLLLSVFLDIIPLEKAAWYNMIAVLIMLPPVLFTGYVEWQKRYRGAKTILFIAKIFCAVLVLGAVNILVFWFLLDPGVLAAESPYRNTYLSIAGVMLVAAGVAGHLGGKLVFNARR